MFAGKKKLSHTGVHTFQSQIERWEIDRDSCERLEMLIIVYLRSVHVGFAMFCWSISSPKDLQIRKILPCLVPQSAEPLPTRRKEPRWGPATALVEGLASICFFGASLELTGYVGFCHVFPRLSCWIMGLLWGCFRLRFAGPPPIYFSQLLRGVMLVRIERFGTLSSRTMGLVSSFSAPSSQCQQGIHKTCWNATVHAQRKNTAKTSAGFRHRFPAAIHKHLCHEDPYQSETHSHVLTPSGRMVLHVWVQHARCPDRTAERGTLSHV